MPGKTGTNEGWNAIFAADRIESRRLNSLDFLSIGAKRSVLELIDS